MDECLSVQATVKRHRCVPNPSDSLRWDQTLAEYKAPSPHKGWLFETGVVYIDLCLTLFHGATLQRQARYISRRIRTPWFSRPSSTPSSDGSD